MNGHLNVIAGVHSSEKINLSRCATLETRNDSILGYNCGVSQFGPVRHEVFRAMQEFACAYLVPVHRWS